MTDSLHNDYVGAMFVFLKSSLLFEPNNPAMLEACDRLADFANNVRSRSGQAEMRFRYDGIYVNQDFMVPPNDKVAQSEYVAGVWRMLDVAVIAPATRTDRTDWLELAMALRRFVRGESTVTHLSQAHVSNIGLLPPRVEDEPSTGDERWELFQAYFFCAAAVRALWDGEAGKPSQLVAVKRPLCRLLTQGVMSRDLLLHLAFEPGRAGADHAVNTALVVGLMALELGLSRKQSIELAMAGLLHGCEYGVGETLARQVDLRQERERNVLRMTIANEYRLTDSSTYPYDPSLASRLVAFAHRVRGPVNFAGLWGAWRKAAPA